MSRLLDCERSLVSLGFWPGWIDGWGQEGLGIVLSILSQKCLRQIQELRLIKPPIDIAFCLWQIVATINTISHSSRLCFQLFENDSFNVIHDSLGLAIF